MATMKSQWRAVAKRVIAQTLAALPKDATSKQKREALFAAYPFDRREMHPYRVWRKEVQKAIGAFTRIGRHPCKIPPRAPKELRPFFEMIVECPAEPGPRMVLADFLEERGDPRAAILREMPPAEILKGRAGRVSLWYHRITGVIPNDTVAGLLIDMIRGKKLLMIDDDMQRAIECEKNERALKLFRQPKVTA